jgi:hypothetical protein
MRREATPVTPHRPRHGRSTYPRRAELAAPSRAERGQAVVEYALIVSFWAMLLFLPVLPRPGRPDIVSPKSGERVSVFMLFVDAFDVYINSFHTVITLPIP